MVSDMGGSSCEPQLCLRSTLACFPTTEVSVQDGMHPPYYDFWKGLELNFIVLIDFSNFYSVKEKVFQTLPTELFSPEGGNTGA